MRTRSKAIRIATFNCENLFTRFKFARNRDASEALRDGWRVDETKFKIYDEAHRRITALAMLSVRADVLCLQEVDGVDALKHFRDAYLGGCTRYPYVAGMIGNDPRRMDVAVLSRLPIPHLRTHQHILDPQRKRFVFSRDCLEADVQIPGGRCLTLYVNHLKSMAGGRDATRSIRQTQCHCIKRIVTDRFGARAGDAPFVILGDFNDYLEADDQGESGIRSLVHWRQIENVMARLRPEERWTHFCSSWKDGYHQLDYLLLSSSLAVINDSVVPEIERHGLPLRAQLYAGQRFEGVGRDDPKASNHCPVVMKLRV